MIFQSENSPLEASEGLAEYSEKAEMGNNFDAAEYQVISPKVSHVPALYPPDVAAALAVGLLQEGVKIPASLPSRRSRLRSPSIALPIEEFPVHRIMDFWRGVDRSFKGIDDCWPWKRAASTGGYGRFKIFGRLYSAHRIAYALTKGGVPAGPGHHGHMVCHTCDNPPCCNPRHLFLGDAKVNAQDMAAKGRCHTQQDPPPHPTRVATQRWER